MSTLTITDFLEARIAEDEALALNAQHHDAKVPGVWATEHHNSEYHDQPKSAHIAEDRAGHYWTVASEVFIPNAEHIARHDPARVLAECAAKRAIIGVHRRIADIYGEALGDTCTTCSSSGPEAQGFPCTTLKALAAVYADHPDYQQEWAL